jgi:hypothetical protein
MPPGLIARVEAWAKLNGMSRLALATTVRHKPNVRIYNLHRNMPLARSRFLYRNSSNPDGATSLSGARIHYVERKERLRMGWIVQPLALELEKHL